MSLDVTRVPAEAVEPLRDLYRVEMNCQIVLDSWHRRGWVDSYVFQSGGRVIGYGLVGGIRRDPVDTVTEFFVLPEHRGAALPLFRRLVDLSGARLAEVQSNDRLFSVMLYDCATEIRSDVVLFEDGLTTHLAAPGATFRRTTKDEGEALARQGLDRDAEWVLEFDHALVAAGGILTHYNQPYGDLYMGVAEGVRRRGFGAFFVQELKRTAYEQGRIPAARCNVANLASRATLQRAGMFPCARVLIGKLRANRGLDSESSTSRPADAP
jgi:GNAT superfamily N-acetyltransferase